jgi:hypothetical protein
MRVVLFALAIALMLGTGIRSAHLAEEMRSHRMDRGLKQKGPLPLFFEEEPYRAQNYDEQGRGMLKSLVRAHIAGAAGILLLLVLLAVTGA